MTESDYELVGWVDWSKPNSIKWDTPELGLPDGCQLYAKRCDHTFHKHITTQIRCDVRCGNLW